jgi:hypothetical protein
MLDRKVVQEFLDDELGEIEIPPDITQEALVETFCKYTEEDYYEWLRDNYKSFFNHSNPNWNWIRGKVKSCPES